MTKATSTVAIVFVIAVAGVLGLTLNLSTDESLTQEQFREVAISSSTLDVASEVAKTITTTTATKEISYNQFVATTTGYEMKRATTTVSVSLDGYKQCRYSGYATSTWIGAELQQVSSSSVQFCKRYLNDQLEYKKKTFQQREIGRLKQLQINEQDYESELNVNDLTMGELTK